MMKHPTVLLCCLLFFLAACSQSGNDDLPPNQPPTAKKIKVNISTTLTRATATAFDMGDMAGLYMVNRDVNGTALLASGNYINNLCFTYNGEWRSPTTVYWKDDTTHADFYFYYPYTATVTNAKAMPFNTATDQSKESAYKSADLIMGSAIDTAPTEAAVQITTRHVMSRMRIKLVAGKGFTDDDLDPSAVQVHINGLKTSGTVDIASGSIMPTGSTATISPLHVNGGYEAIVIPQRVGESNLITVTIGGQDYNLSTPADLKSGQSYTFTVTLAKTSSGINVSISNWEDDGNDYGGVAE